MGKIKVDCYLKTPNFSTKIWPTETYNIPNQWKFNGDFAELYRFKIAGLIEGDNLVFMSPLFYTCESKMECAYKLVSVKWYFLFEEMQLFQI